MNAMETSTSTVYTPLLEQLRERLREEGSVPGLFLGTELDFARRNRISRDSVRLATDQLIAEGLVERRPGRGVFSRATVTQKMIELVVPNFGPLWSDLATGAHAAGREHGVSVHVINADGNFEADVEAVRRLPEIEMEGAVIGSLHRARLTEAVIELHRRRFPLVLADQRLTDVDVPSVTFDNHAAGYLAGQELLRQGHRRIGFVGYAEQGAVRGRLDGLRDSVNDAGLPFDRSLVDTVALEPVDPWPAAAPARAAVLRAWLNRPERPTAIIFHTDPLALEAYPAIRALGLRIPEDVSVVGFGGGLGVAAMPSLASVALPMIDMGRVAARMLIERIAAPKSLAAHSVLPVRWQAGGSVASANATSSSRGE
jgi:LacI family transcriptional regulator